MRRSDTSAGVFLEDVDGVGLEVSSGCSTSGGRVTFFPDGAWIRPAGGLREDLLGLGGGVVSGEVLPGVAAAAAAAPEVLPP